MDMVSIIIYLLWCMNEWNKIGSKRNKYYLGYVRMAIMHFGACDVFIYLCYAIDVVVILMCCFWEVIIKFLIG